jgi:hypothetical protein
MLVRRKVFIPRSGLVQKSLTFTARKSLLKSGYLKGEKYLQNKVFAVEVPLGEEKVILLGFGV